MRGERSCARAALPLSSPASTLGSTATDETFLPATRSPMPLPRGHTCKRDNTLRAELDACRGLDKSPAASATAARSSATAN